MQNSNFISINLLRSENINQIFNVINNIELYCEFLPFCKNIFILEQKIYYNSENHKILKRIVKVHVKHLSISHEYICIIFTNYAEFTINIFIKENSYIKYLHTKWQLNKYSNNIKENQNIQLNYENTELNYENKNTQLNKVKISFKMKYSLQYNILNSFAKKIIPSQVEYIIDLFIKRLIFVSKNDM
ncbi:MAG: hypothetical protein U1E31_01355 [Rickettsiales bacterium]